MISARPPTLRSTLLDLWIGHDHWLSLSLVLLSHSDPEEQEYHRRARAALTERLLGGELA